MMEMDEKVKIIEALTKGGNVSIGQMSVGDHNTMNYYAQGDTVPQRKVSIDDVVEGIKQCRTWWYAQAAMTVVYAICRDEYHWTMSQSEFERKMSLCGEKCPEGTIANTIRNNPYMRDHVSKWATMGARQEVLTLRDEFQKAINAMPQKEAAT